MKKINFIKRSYKMLFWLPVAIASASQAEDEGFDPPGATQKFATVIFSWKRLNLLIGNASVLWCKKN